MVRSGRFFVINSQGTPSYDGMVYLETEGEMLGVERFNEALGLKYVLYSPDTVANLIQNRLTELKTIINAARLVDDFFAYFGIDGYTVDSVIDENGEWRLETAKIE